MNTRLSLLIVFLKSLLPAPGASFSPDLDPRCPADTTISGDEEWANITTMQNLMDTGGMLLYMHPDPGFKGVRVVAAGDGWQQDAWFTLDNTCFPMDAQWWTFWASVWRGGKNYKNNDNYLVFRVKTGDCALKCRRTARFPGAMNVTVAAQGPSRWRLLHPTPCTEQLYIRDTYSRMNCTSPPTTTPTTTIVIIVVPVVIGVAVVVVLLVVVTKCYRQQRESPDVRMRFQGEGEVVENSLYETLDNTRRTEVVENSLYEPLDNTRPTEVVENSLYETLDNTRRTEVLENTLYETFENVRKPQ